jgi:hypothetical protein
MRYRRPYRLPLLLSLLSTPLGVRPGGMGGRPRLAQLRQVIRLAREGIREYSHKLDALERQIGRGAWEHEDELNTVPFVLRERDDEYAPARDDDFATREAERVEESPRLTEQQIHHLFERLAIHRCSLNPRGYPYTSEVNEMLRRIHPSEELLSREEVEDAWDDWRNVEGKRLFRRADRRDRALDSRENEEVERELRRLSQEEFEVIFAKLRRDRVLLNLAGYPDVAAVLRHQKEMFEQTVCVTSVEVERAFDRWEGRHAYFRDVRRDEDLRRGQGGEEFSSVRGAGGAGNGYVYGAYGAPPDVRWTFRVFDEILLSGDLLISESILECIPTLATVNERLAHRGERPLESDDALRIEWRDYLIEAASVRDGRIRERGPREEFAAGSATRAGAAPRPFPRSAGTLRSPPQTQTEVGVLEVESVKKNRKPAGRGNRRKRKSP